VEQAKFSCVDCSFHTNFKQRYNRHINTEKHKAQIENNESNETVYTCNCGKKYKSNVGLWKHKQKCNNIQLVHVNTTAPDTSNIDKKMDELKTLIIEMKDTQKPVTNNILNANTNNNTNNILNNNSININLVLNEKCNNAKNFVDMIRDMKLDEVYHDSISSLDYVDTIFKMIKREMDKLPFIERPIQCIKDEDNLQQILHIRHENEWRKETELEWTQQIHNFYIDDGDEVPPDQEKIIFVGLKNMEDNIIEQIRHMYSTSYKCKDKEREYKYEMDHMPNKIRIIKCLLEYINVDKDELMQIIESAYNEVKNPEINNIIIS